MLLNGIALAEIGEDERARVRNEHVGFVFQNFQLIPTLTALENVTVPMELRGDRSARRLGAGIVAAGRPGRARSIIIPRNFPAANSSASPWRALSSIGPKILFADEPTGNLDAETSQSVIEIMLELNRERRNRARARDARSRRRRV